MVGAFGCDSRSIREPISDLESVSKPMYFLLRPDIGIGRLGLNSFFVGTNSVCGSPTSMKFISVVLINFLFNARSLLTILLHELPQETSSISNHSINVHIKIGKPASFLIS